MKTNIQKLSEWTKEIEKRIEEQGLTEEILQESSNALNLAKWLQDETFDTEFEREVDELHFRLFKILW